MDLAKMEQVVTYEHEFGPRAAGTERTINKALSEGWVIVTSKIVQVGSERDGLRSQHCIVLGKPKARQPQTDLKDVGEVFVRQCTNTEAATNVINRHIEEGWILQKLQPANERGVRDGEPYERNYMLLMMVKPRTNSMAEKLEERKKKSYRKR